MPALVTDIFSFNNPVFNAYAFYCCVLGTKMLLMSMLTARQRFKKGVFASPEDVKGRKDAKVKVDDDVERVRRAHLNDIENIYVFIFVCGFYLLTSPASGTAIMLIRAYTLARIMHTLVYAVVVIPQPARGLSWGVAYGITGYMAFKTIMHFSAFM